LLDICPFDNRCMNQITVEQVLAAAHASLHTISRARAESGITERHMGLQ
jgi:hypothetical protein